MTETLTHAIEDYLKAIYDLTLDEGWATTNSIAERMRVTPASATGMIQRLAAANPPLLEYRKHHGVLLTPAGERVALEVIRHHRLIELFLQRTLGYSWDEVHAEADRLEHVISEQFEERIAQALGDPLHDPHGEPIPTRDLRLPPRLVTRLCDLRPGQQAVVRQIENPEPELLRYLSAQCLTPGVRLTVVDYSPYDDNLRLSLEGCAEPITLGLRVTRRVLMEVQ
jgi:DtxR family Mn-dependent transcriptional regulator